MTYDKILILDLGRSYAHVLAHRLRAISVYCEIHQADVSDQWLQDYAADGRLKGVIVIGHGDAADGTVMRLPPPVLFELGVPVLGIDAGMRVMAQMLGGAVHQTPKAPMAQVEVRAHGHTRLLIGIEDFQSKEGHGMLNAWMHEGSQVSQLPEGFSLMASSAHCALAGMADEERKFYGIQFHLECPPTPQGTSILMRFALDICGAAPHWVIGDYVEEAVQAIRQRVGEQRVLLGLSGGVDSSVAAALIQRAIGNQLICVFVDHGLLRRGEADKVLAMVSDELRVNVVRVDAGAQFLEKLAGVTDPEQKRKIIGREFVNVFKVEAAKLMAQEDLGSSIRFLAQGTIYSDVIESGKKNQVAVKSHHNVGGLPEQLGLQLLEPLRELFKEEVRRLGLALGLPRSLVYRHPFPGPGLGVRIVGEVRAEYANILRAADAIFTEELRSTPVGESTQSWYEAVSQAFAVFVPVKSVGVTDGARTYEHVIALRAVQSVDFMTAEWAELPYDLLRRVSTRIIREVAGVNRVVYDVSSKPPATIEWE